MKEKLNPKVINEAIRVFCKFIRAEIVESGVSVDEIVECSNINRRKIESLLDDNLINLSISDFVKICYAIDRKPMIKLANQEEYNEFSTSTMGRN